MVIVMFVFRVPVSLILACIPFYLAGWAAAVQGQTPLERPEVPRGLDLYIPTPDDNRPTPEKVALGKRLFNERLLSRDQSLSCSSCHDPQRAFTDGKPVAVGVFDLLENVSQQRPGEELVKSK
jgi:cytochrome c peroxidase